MFQMNWKWKDFTIMLAHSHLGKNSADDFLKYFSYFSQKTGFDISCKLSPMEIFYMKCQILFFGKNKKNVINLSSAELAKTLLKGNYPYYTEIASLSVDFSSYNT